MKLKVLIIPIVLIIAIITAAVIILPKALEVVNLTKEQKKAEQSLAVTKERVEKSSKLSQELSVNTDKQNVLLRYVPTSKQEEDAINNLNAVASASGVSLVELSLSRESGITNALPEGEMGEASEGDVNFKKAPSNAIKTVDFEITTLGSYEQTKSFLENLNSMQRFAEIISLEISKTKGADGVDSGKLQAGMVLGFGYLDKINIVNVNSEVLNSGFNMSVIDKITNNAKTGFSEINIGQTGRANPFLP